MERGEEQDEVGAGGPQDAAAGAVIDDELLGEDRDADRGADGPEVVDRAAEPVRLAQDRDRDGAAGRVGTGAGHEVVAGCRRSRRPTARHA